MSDIPPSRRTSRWVLAPLVLVLIGAALWSAGWFYAAHRADGIMTAWMEREAREGRSYACGERNVGGFPFRIEVRCDDLTIDLNEAAGPVRLTAQHVLAVAQIYQPDLIIAEATGPMTVSVPGGGGAAAQEYVAEWRLLQASLRGRPQDLRRLSIVVDEPALSQPGAAAAASTPVARAGRLEFHVMRDDAEYGRPVLNLAGRTSGALVAMAPTLADRQFNAEMTAVLSGAEDLAARLPLAERLRRWQAANGRLQVTNVRMEQEDALATATGIVSLTGDGHLDGRFDLKLAGLDHVTRLALGPEAAAGGTAGLLAGLSLLGRADLEGRRAVAVPLAFREGRVFFGPIPVARTEPLF